MELELELELELEMEMEWAGGVGGSPCGGCTFPRRASRCGRRW